MQYLIKTENIEKIMSEDYYKCPDCSLMHELAFTHKIEYVIVDDAINGKHIVGISKIKPKKMPELITPIDYFLASFGQR